ncbi:MAG: hypothetical protein HY912_21255 [Desulfomonile tiedjei]|uniref:Membrane protein involved in the export of O-antigen and teichoic acid n=1 Tax=Desulfomonile tiedjei TaxID=2358 RepID=A0A9D6Z5I9_9BACT|nr:hypothetical protein [Desulfomonile tiedjei]
MSLRIQKFQITSQSAKALMVRTCGLGLMYVATAAAANYLGAMQFGVFSSVLSLTPILAAIAVGGVDVFAAKTLATISDRNPSKIAREVAVTHADGLLGIAFGLALISMIVIAAVSLGINEDKYGVLIHAMYIFPVFLLIYIRQYITVSLSSAANAMFPEQVILPSLFVLGLAVAHIFFSPLSTGLVLGNYFCAAVLTWITGLYLIRNESCIARSLTVPLTVRDLVDRLNSGRPFLLAAVSSVIMTNAVTVLVSLFFGFKEAGLYFAAWRLAHLPSMPLQVIENVVMPSAARLHSLGDREGLSNLARFSATLSCASGIAISVVLICFHERFLSLFGQEFVGAGPVLIILLIGQTLTTVTGPKQSLMRMTGLEIVFSRTFAVASVLLPLAVYLAARFGGIVAVALCVAVMVAALDLTFCLFLWKKRGVVSLPYGPGVLLKYFSRTQWRQSTFQEKVKFIWQILSL